MLAARPTSGIDTRRVTTLDGVSIAYRVVGPSGAPWVVLANGLGGSAEAWRPQIEYLGDRYRFLSWDYRGLHGSTRPAEDVDTSYTIGRHAADLEAVLDAEGVSRASFVGWSLGAQVVIESFRRMRSRVANLVLVNGTYGRPIDTLTPLPGASTVIPPLLDLMRRAHALAAGVSRRTVGRPEAVTWMKRLGLVGETADEALLADLARSFAELDLEPFFRIVKAAGDHDAEPLLSSIDVPVLIVAGDRDPFTPRELAHQMARRIAESEILVVPGGTHYVALEFPDLVSLRVERFYRDRGFEAG